MQRTISAELLAKLNELGRLALNAVEAKEQARQVVSGILSIGRAEGFTDKEIKELIMQQLRNKGLTGQATFYRYLPAELKDPRKVRAGRLGGSNSAITMIAESGVETATTSQAEVNLKKDLDFALQQNYALRKRVAELEALKVGHEKNESETTQTEIVKVKVLRKEFGKLYSSLRDNVIRVELLVDPQTLEVYDVEVIKE